MGQIGVKPSCWRKCCVCGTGESRTVRIQNYLGHGKYLRPEEQSRSKYQGAKLMLGRIYAYAKAISHWERDWLPCQYTEIASIIASVSEKKVSRVARHLLWRNSGISGSALPPDLWWVRRRHHLIHPMKGKRKSVGEFLQVSLFYERFRWGDYSMGTWPWT